VSCDDPGVQPRRDRSELLAAEPVVLTGIRIGYAWLPVGRKGRAERAWADLVAESDGRLDELIRAGCGRIFVDTKVGKYTDRPELAAALDVLRPGDTLVVPALDRLSRSLADLIAVVGDLRRREVGFASLHEGLDTTTPGGRLVFHVFAALAEFIRELIAADMPEGSAGGREPGRVGGRPTVTNPELIRAARELLTHPEHSIVSIAKLLGVSRGTLYNHIPDLHELRSSTLPGVSTTTAFRN